VSKNGSGAWLELSRGTERLRTWCAILSRVSVNVRTWSAFLRRNAWNKS